MTHYLTESKFKSVLAHKFEPYGFDEELLYGGMAVCEEDIKTITLTVDDVADYFPKESLEWVFVNSGNIIYLPELEDFYWIRSCYGPYKHIEFEASPVSDLGTRICIQTHGDGKITEWGDRDNVLYDEPSFAFPVADRYIAAEIGATHELMPELM